MGSCQNYGPFLGTHYNRALQPQVDGETRAVEIGVEPLKVEPEGLLIGLNPENPISLNFWNKP